VGTALAQTLSGSKLTCTFPNSEATMMLPSITPET
jgi:hypothetical protein